MTLDFNFEMSGTKADIFYAALDLFSRYGYQEVSMNQIAHAVGISPGAIYNHFSGKDMILEHIYRYYQYCNETFHPPLEELYIYLETHSPIDTLWQIVNVFPEDIEKRMYAILAIATSLPNDVRAQMLISKHFFHYPTYYLSSLLGKMLEQDLIEPIDVDSLCFVYASVCHSMTIRMHDGDEAEKQLFMDAVKHVFGFIREKN